MDSCGSWSETASEFAVEGDRTMDMNRKKQFLRLWEKHFLSCGIPGKLEGER